VASDAMKVVERFEELFMEGDLQAVLEVVAEDIVTYEAPSLPYAGEHVGHDGWLHLAEAFNATWEPTGELHCEFLDCGHNVVAARVELDVVARATGKPVQLRIAEFHKVRDGKIQETTIYYWDTAAMLDALAP
jgi:ketosteroid isomerase-like protein